MSNKHYYEKRKQAGICTSCGKVDAAKGSLKCEECSNNYRQYIHQRHHELKKQKCCIRCGLPSAKTKCAKCIAYLKEQSQKMVEERKKNALCVSCGLPIRSKFVYCSVCLVIKKEANQKCRDKLRKTVIESYGGKCVCCEEANFAFLSIDHINGGGNQHRKELFGRTGSSHSFYRWLKKNGFPEGFQVLCHNCNFAKWRYGKCPHQNCENQM